MEKISDNKKIIVKINPEVPKEKNIALRKTVSEEKVLVFDREEDIGIEKKEERKENGKERKNQVLLRDNFLKFEGANK